MPIVYCEAPLIPILKVVLQATVPIVVSLLLIRETERLLQPDKGLPVSLFTNVTFALRMSPAKAS